MASSTTAAEVITNKWNTGAPWEPIIIQMNISDSEREVKNDTLF